MEFNRTEEVEEFRLLALNQRIRAAHFEEPASPRASRPGGDDSRIIAGHIDRRKIRVSRIHRNNRGRNFLVIERRQPDLPSPSINVVGIASALAREGYNGNIDLAAVFI